MTKGIIIKNGYLVNPGAGMEGYADLVIREGRVQSIIARESDDASVSANEVSDTIKRSNVVSDADSRDNDESESDAESRNNEDSESGNRNPAGEITIIDAKGMYVFPGLVDVHSHFRDPGFTYKEDILSGAKAAAAGGYTDVVLMCNTKPVVDTTETLRYVLDKGKQTDIHVHSCSSVSMGLKGEALTEMDAMKSAGAVGFTDDGIPLMDADFLEAAMKKTAALGLPISLHEEDKNLITNNGINRGKASEFYNVGGSPKEAEVSLIRRDLDIALKTGAIVDIQHVSAKESVELIRKALEGDGRLAGVRETEKKEKIGIREKTDYTLNGDTVNSDIANDISSRRIHAEATPQHFTLTEDALIEKGANAKLNPPLRTEEDRLGIIEGLRDNTIDLIATDHAPHAPEEKEKPITEAPSGMLGLETALSLSYEKLVLEAKLPLSDVIAKLTCNPAAVYKLDAGIIREGGKADICIFNPNEEYVLATLHSKSVNSPFLGRTMKGQVVMTICEGRIVYRAD